MTDKLKLSEPMRQLLIRSTPGITVERGPTRAALMRRGLVSRMDTGPAHAARLTKCGRDVREALLAEQVRP